MKDLFPFYSIGHFLNQPENPAEFEITRFENMVDPDVRDVHKHTFYEILWVDEGKSQQTIDYQTYSFGKNSLFFISPGQVHEFEEWQPLSGGTIMFTSDFFLLNQQNKDPLFELSFLDNVYACPNLKPTIEDFQEARNTIELLILEKNRIDASVSILQSFLNILLLQIQRSIDKASPGSTPKRNIVIYKKFLAQLETNFKNCLTISEYASALHITPHHLNRIVKGISGKTVSGVIRSRNILEAKRLLTFTDLTITEIAAELNFFDSSYFAKLFKKETGHTPLAFRESMSEKYRIK